MAGYNPETQRRWYEKNAEKKKAYARARYAANPEKAIKYAKERREKNPREWIKSHLLRLYGLSQESFDALLKSQGEKCAICGLFLDGKSKISTPHVDHCHRTNRVRGILCSRCNISLGHIEKAGFLVLALNYLEQHGSK